MARLRKGVDEMRILFVLLASVLVLCIAACHSFAESPQPVDLETVLAQSPAIGEYRLLTWDCREMSAVLYTHLKANGYEAGTARISHNDSVHHRVVWVTLPNQLVFIEPQTNEIMTFDQLATTYGDFETVTLFDHFNKNNDRVMYYES